ncbi:MAG: hypothetical protein ACRD5H_01880 [Nitrososphaerales archaeon]
MAEIIFDDEVAHQATPGPQIDPGMIEHIRSFILGGGQQAEPDIVGKLKSTILGPEPQPGARSLFGETELPGQIIRGVGEFALPGSLPEAAAGAVLAKLGPVARQLEKIPVAGLVVSAPKRILKGALEAGGELFRPGVAREAGVEIAAKKLGQPMGSAERALGVGASAKAFEMAKSVISPVDISAQIKVAKNNLVGPTGMSNPPAAAVRWINNMEKTLQGPQPYNRIVKELSALRGAAEKALRGATPDSNTAKVLYKLRADALDALDNVSPAIKEANRFYKEEEAAKSVFSVLRKPSSGTNMRELVEHDPLVASTFKSNPKKLGEIYNIADKLGSIAGESPMGVGNRVLGAMNNLSEIVINDDAARSMLRWTLDNTEVVKLPAALNNLGHLIGQTTRAAAFRTMEAQP